MHQTNQPRWLTTSEAARYLEDVHKLDIAVTTLQNWRAVRPYTGPTYRSIRNRVSYRTDWLDEWVVREEKIVEAAA